LVHRDIKPDNLIRGRGQIFVVDLGIAISQTQTGRAGTLDDDSNSHDGRHTCVGGMVGTTCYASPEQVQDLPLDGRSDQYSLGLVLFELATGEKAVESLSPEADLFRQVHAELPDPREINPRVSGAFAKIILRATQKMPSRRFPTAGVMKSALAKVPASGPATVPEKKRSYNIKLVVLSESDLPRTHTTHCLAAA
jgi:serine/threonine protein kinase